MKVIVGSALVRNGRPDIAAAAAFAETLGVDRIIGAVDSKQGQVVVHGWKTPTALTSVEAVRALEPYCSEFLYTHVDTEGLMGGIPMDAVMAVRQATSRRLIAAGGIRSREEVDALHKIGIDAVVGMAIYTGALALDGDRRE
jgi:phosphoribosylformimino-5-aminoimidazole carboxamide ribotide isomerase